MTDGITVKITGLEAVRVALAGVVDKLRTRILRNALAAGGRVYRDEARRLTPVLRLPVRRKNGLVVRKPGTVRNAISVRTSRIAKRSGDVGVFVNVRPAKGAKYGTRTTSVLGLRIKSKYVKRASMIGANSPNDPYYWRWLELPAKGKPLFGMLHKAAARKGSQALARIKDSLSTAVAKLNTKGGGQ